MKTLVALVALFAAVVLSGCGYSTTTQVCFAGSLNASASDGVDFTLTPMDTDIDIYPGETKAISVAVGSVRGSQGQVTVGGVSLPQGVTLTGGTATIGSTATLTVTAALDVVPYCFPGEQGVYTAARRLTLTGSDARGTAKSDVALNISLENREFQPAATDLPVLTINTDGGEPVGSEDDYVNATLTIVDASTPSNNYTGTMGIKGHGNSTWQMPKKPYRLNLDNKAALLGMASDSNWILLANYDDKTLVRNDISMQISQITGLLWTPTMKFVEVYLNGTYEGVYNLSEKVEVSKARLNIGSIDTGDDSGADVTGGYLGEIDQGRGETLMITGQTGLPIGLADPDPPDAIQGAYFTAAFHAAEGSLYASNFTDPTNGWRKSWDETSLINWYLVEELAGNEDSDDTSSDFFYKPRSDDRFYMGPVWDMDITFGNVSYDAIASPNVLWTRTQADWYKRLFQDPVFLANVKARYAAIRPQLLTLSGTIDAHTAALALGEQNNFQRWPILGERVWPNNHASGSYQGEVDFMKTWLTARIAFLDSVYLQ